MNAITLTEAAAIHIKKMLAQDLASIGFRISIKKTGCSGYAYVPEIISQKKAQDIHFVTEQNISVFIDPACEAYIKNTVIDYAADALPGLKQKRLIFINPNEKNRCGCGESFTVE